MFFDFTIASLGFDFFQQSSFPDNWKKTHREQIRRWHVFFVVAGVCFGKLEALNLGLWSWNLWVFGTFLWWIQDGKHWSNNMVWRCLNNGGWKISGWQFFRLAVFQETSDLLVFFGGVCESESWNSCRFPGGRSNTSLYVTGRRHWKTLPLFEHVDFFSTWRYCMFFFPKKNISIKCWFIKVQRSHGMERRDGISQQNWESKRVDLTKTIHFSSAERLLELAEGTLRILWMQQFSRGMFDVQLDLLLLLLVDVLKIHRICKRMCHIKQIGSHGSCTIFDRLWVARKLTTLIRANKTKHPGMDAGKYRDKRTNQVQTTYGPEDQHGTWE